MNKKVHKVAKGETLWGISKHYGIPLKNLADWNNLTGRLIHNINIGQKIYLYPPQEEIDTFLTIRLLDLAFNPINTATLNLEYYGLKKEVKILNGNSPVITIKDHTKGVKVYFKSNLKGFYLIADHKKLPLGKKKLVLTSRMMKSTGVYGYKEGAENQKVKDVKIDLKNKNKELLKEKNEKSTPMPLISKDNNELKNQKGVLIATGENISVSGNSQKQKLPQVNLPETIDKSVRTEGGEKTHAIAKVGIEGNLRLVAANEIYRKDILDAEKKYGISAATIAALICIETGGGKIENKWDPNAVNPQGTGVGLGQFFTPTWLELATDKTGKLNQYIVKKKGYKLLVGSGRWRGYTLSDDQRTEEQKKKKLQQPIVKLNSKDISWINSLRTDAGLSIDTIALSAKKNLEGLKSRLKKNGLATSGIDNLNPLEMSKLIYFCHHESPGSAYLIMRNSIDKDTAKTNFEANVSKKVQAKYLKQGNNNYIQAYKIWMYENLIDTKVHTLEFMLNTNGLCCTNRRKVELF
ncbi:LysM peptidoglycan-binding domain-containing protein [Acinetobacter junii]|uniref:LysM peptidoglycan-binding domain-containing protein n=1 Tax=Acinetobacter junii TaxID=40215 RepID=UPI00124F8E56|nr:LysM peptidoglycan-binding domain-containing protein [Acinetobacter junii]